MCFHLDNGNTMEDNIEIWSLSQCWLEYSKQIRVLYWEIVVRRKAHGQIQTISTYKSQTTDQVKSNCVFSELYIYFKECCSILDLGFLSNPRGNLVNPVDVYGFALP